MRIATLLNRFSKINENIFFPGGGEIFPATYWGWDYVASRPKEIGSGVDEEMTHFLKL